MCAFHTLGQEVGTVRFQHNPELANAAVWDVQELADFVWGESAVLVIHQILDEHPDESAVTADQNVGRLAAAEAVTFGREKAAENELTEILSSVGDQSDF